MANLSHSKAFNKPVKQSIKVKYNAIFEKHKHMREDGLYDFFLFTSPTRTNGSNVVSQVECGDEIGKNNIEQTLNDYGVLFNTVKVGNLYRIWVNW